MAGYFIYMRRTVIDEAKNREYIQGVGATLRQFDGELVARGASVETLEGELQLPPITMFRFPSLERLREWYDSSEYAPLLRLRLESSTGDFVTFEGA
ncbi:MAG TPA: DUF1330 domain-containing protein [Nitrolancea sp.]|nr:DUF1330 domain-containing protein [Nitrolancea sp.]